MIRPLSALIVSYLVNMGAITNSNDDKEYYQYGVEITISSFLNIFLILCLGTALHKINHAIVFLAVFISLRHLTGGFHASTYFKCNLSLCIVFILDIFSNEITHNYFTAITFIVHILLSSLVILVYCPVENKNKPIPDECIWKYKISALILSHTFSIIGWILFRNNIDIGLFIIMTIIYIHILVVVSKLIREEEKHESK